MKKILIALVVVAVLFAAAMLVVPQIAEAGWAWSPLCQWGC